jgi:hypothetical protein
MRKLNYLWLLLFFCIACEEEGPTDDDDSPTIAEERLALIEDIVWVPGTITGDGNNLLELYPSYQNFKLGFGGVILNSDKTNVSNGQYVVQGDLYEIMGSSPGPWMFKEGDEANTLIMMNGIEVNYTVSETSLRLEFTRTPPPISRTQAIVGDYVFDLVPEN